MKYIKMLQYHKINIIMVFDGMKNTSKELTEKRRRESRSQAKAKGAELLAAGKPDEAKKEFDKAVEIKHEHALALMNSCREENVDCITSMYESDAQLAYLNKIGLADYVISEDSDLILFGCKKIIFKLSLSGSCTFFDASKLHLSLGVPEDKFSFEKFRRIAILSGCDYLDSLPGIGLAKAAKFMMMTAESDMQKALLKLPSYLNMKDKINVTEEYIEGFLKAEAAFKYMFVYDPLKKKMVRLNELDNTEDEEYCSQTGRELDDENAYQLALGNINPRTFQVVANFDPRKAVKKSTNLKTNPHISIWRCNMDEFKKFSKNKSLGNQQTKITCFVPVEKVNDPKVREIIEQENMVDQSFATIDLINQYKIEFHSPSRQTMLRDESSKENETSELIQSRKNPFAKQTTTESVLKAEETSFMSKVVVKPAKVISRFFQNSSVPIESSELQAKINKERLDKELQEKLERSRKFYAIVKNPSNVDNKIQEIIESDENDQVSTDELENLIVKEEVKIIKPKALPPIVSKSASTKVALSLKRKAKTIGDSHPKLSKFGFTRNSQ